MAVSLYASVKVSESVWRLSVEGGCFGKAISLNDGTHTLMTDQTEVRNAEHVRARHLVVKKKKNVVSVYRSYCMKHFPGQFTRIRLKIEQNSRLF